MARREPAAGAEAQQLVADNLELDAATFDDPVEDDGDGGPDDELEDDGSDEGAEEDGGAPIGDEEDDSAEIREPGPDDLDGMTLESEPPRQPREREAKFDKKGNIIDVKTGKIIAPAGPAARFYQEAYKAKQESVTHRARADDLSQRLNKAIEIGQGAFAQAADWKAKAENPVAKQLGLADNEVVDALQLAKEAKTNPKGALQKLLTRAAANGIDITTLGLSGAEGTAALMSMVREEMGKLTQPISDAQKREADRVASERERQQVFERTEANVRRYFEERPDQVRHMPIYKAVLENPRFRGMSLGEIGARIEMNLLKQRFEGGRNGRKNPQTRSRPNGRGVADGSEPSPREEQMAPVTSTWDEILRPIVAKHYRA